MLTPATEHIALPMRVETRSMAFSVPRSAGRSCWRAAGRRRRWLGVALLPLLTLAASIAWGLAASSVASAQTITIIDSAVTDTVTTFVYDGIDGAVVGTLNPTSLPYADTSSSVDGVAQSQTSVDFSDARLRFDFALTRATGLGSFAQLVTALQFIPSADIDFEASGSIQAVDADGRRILYFASFDDATMASSVFQHAQESRVTPNEGFTLGLAEGDFQNSASGALSGTLMAGHLYLLQLNIVIETNGAATATGATASGDFALDFFPLGAIPEDADRFLTFLNAVSPEHAEDENSALAYYATIDPNGDRETLGDWLVANGFGGGATASAVYVNEADLGFGRKMFVKTHPDGRVASYVVNYGDDTPPTPSNPTADPVDGPAAEKIDNAHNDQNIIATVAMEYGPPANDPSANFFTTFYAFAPDGSRLQQADLDGRGAKSLPGACNICHGGNPRPVLEDGGYPGRGDTGAGFLPWDLGAFGYSETLYGGLPIYNRPSQEADFKALNAAVLATNPNSATRELIEGWYGGPGLPDSTFDELFVPPGWVGHEAAYLEVFAPNCRACHVMRSPALAFQSYGEFQLLRERATHHVFDRSIMPLARRTYDRFWSSFPGVTDPAILDLFGSLPASRKPGRSAPLSFAGPDSKAAVGFPERLDGGDSSYSTSFSWTPISRPAGSVSPLDDPLLESPSFTPDVAGDYEFELTTTNGVGSTTDLVRISATGDGSDPGIDFEGEIFPLFVARCESCHDGSIGPDFLGGATSYSSRVQKIYQAFSSRVNVLDPGNSVLVQKSGGALGHGGGGALTLPAEVAMLTGWIEEGASRTTRAAHYTRVGIVLPIPITTLSGVLLPSYDGVDVGPDALLNGADLSDANLLGADLRGVSAIGTRFIGTTLVIADLSGANLSGANLDLANLTGATLTGALYDENTIFPSGTTFDAPPLGLSGGATPWDLGMIPVPEPGFGSGLSFGILAAIRGARRRRRSPTPGSRRG